MQTNIYCILQVILNIVQCPFWCWVHIPVSFSHGNPRNDCKQVLFCTFDLSLSIPLPAFVHLHLWVLLSRFLWRWLNGKSGGSYESRILHNAKSTSTERRRAFSFSCKIFTHLRKMPFGVASFLSITVFYTLNCMILHYVSCILKWCAIFLNGWHSIAILIFFVCNKYRKNHAKEVSVFTKLFTHWNVRIELGLLIWLSTFLLGFYGFRGRVSFSYLAVGQY